MPDGDPRPRLMPVPDPDPVTRSDSESAKGASAGVDPQGASSPTPTEASGERSRRWLSILLILAIAVLVGLYGAALRDNARLETSVKQLEGELAGAQAQIGAYEIHLDDVRAGVGGVSAQLEVLEGILERGPESPPGF